MVCQLNAASRPDGWQEIPNSMTELLQTAFSKAALLSTEEQNLLALRLLAELDAENQFDLAIEGSADKLAGLAAEAREEYRRGETRELDPDL